MACHCRAWPRAAPASNPSPHPPPRNPPRPGQEGWALRRLCRSASEAGIYWLRALPRAAGIGEWLC
eukprot:scaffold15662_cov109-Isochrysis_galbana.AAC.14